MNDTPAKLNQPWRALVALAEVVLAGLAVWGAFQVWHVGVKTVTMTLTDGTVLTSTRYFGNWISGAIGLGVLAAVLLVDAVRELMLAVRARHRRKPRKADSEGTIEDYVAHLNAG